MGPAQQLRSVYPRCFPHRPPVGPRPAAMEPLEGRRLFSVALNAAGWTIVTPSSTARHVYVSSAHGNDKNSGLSAAAPVASLAAATALVRTGTDDQLLLERGNTWTTSFPPVDQVRRQRGQPHAHRHLRHRQPPGDRHRRRQWPDRQRQDRGQLPRRPGPQLRLQRPRYGPGRRLGRHRGGHPDRPAAPRTQHRRHGRGLLVHLLPERRRHPGLHRPREQHYHPPQHRRRLLLHVHPRPGAVRRGHDRPDAGPGRVRPQRLEHGLRRGQPDRLQPRRLRLLHRHRPDGHQQRHL